MDTKETEISIQEKVDLLGIIYNVSPVKGTDILIVEENGKYGLYSIQKKKFVLDIMYDKITRWKKLLYLTADSISLGLGVIFITTSHETIDVRYKINNTKAIGRLKVIETTDRRVIIIDKEDGTIIADGKFIQYWTERSRDRKSIIPSRVNSLDKIDRYIHYINGTKVLINGKIEVIDENEVIQVICITTQGKVMKLLDYLKSKFSKVYKHRSLDLLMGESTDGSLYAINYNGQIITQLSKEDKEFLLNKAYEV